MKIISFYPGPSRVDDHITRYVREAYAKGILSINHRSDTFVKICKKTTSLLKVKLNIPDNYTIFFTSSATECWEIIAQSLVKTNSYHFYNGDFGKKWFEYTQKLRPYAIGYQFDEEQELKTGELDLSTENGVICITQNETSNGTQINNARVAKLRKKYPDHLIAVDATSSMAGISLDFTLADVWYASVQKCFGLPAGLAIMVCSPATMEQAKRIGDNRHYNSLNFMAEKMAVCQTTHTPNILAIYLLMRVMAARKPIDKIEKKLKERWKSYARVVGKSNLFTWHIKNKDVRSDTVIVVSGAEHSISDIKEKAVKEGIVLGNGYGALKKTTFRIANFPALKNTEVKILKQFLKQHLLPDTVNTGQEQ